MKNYNQITQEALARSKNRKNKKRKVYSLLTATIALSLAVVLISVSVLNLFPNAGSDPLDPNKPSNALNISKSKLTQANYTPDLESIIFNKNSKLNTYAESDSKNSLDTASDVDGWQTYYDKDMKKSSSRYAEINFFKNNAIKYGEEIKNQIYSYNNYVNELEIWSKHDGVYFKIYNRDNQTFFELFDPNFTSSHIKRVRYDSMSWEKECYKLNGSYLKVRIYDNSAGKEVIEATTYFDADILIDEVVGAQQTEHGERIRKPLNIAKTSQIKYISFVEDERYEWYEGNSVFDAKYFIIENSEDEWNCLNLTRENYSLWYNEMWEDPQYFMGISQVENDTHIAIEKYFTLTDSNLASISTQTSIVVTKDNCFGFNFTSHALTFMNIDLTMLSGWKNLQAHFNSATKSFDSFKFVTDKKTLESDGDFVSPDPKNEIINNIFAIVYADGYSSTSLDKINGHLMLRLGENSGENFYEIYKQFNTVLDTLGLSYKNMQATDKEKIDYYIQNYENIIKKVSVCNGMTAKITEEPEYIFNVAVSNSFITKEMFESVKKYVENDSLKK